MALDRLPELDLLGVPLLRVQLSPQAAQVLRRLALFVALTGSTLARALLVVQPTSMLLYRPFDILVLRLYVFGGGLARRAKKGSHARGWGETNHCDSGYS